MTIENGAAIRRQLLLAHPLGLTELVVSLRVEGLQGDEPHCDADECDDEHRGHHDETTVAAAPDHACHVSCSSSVRALQPR